MATAHRRQGSRLLVVLGLLAAGTTSGFVASTRTPSRIRQPHRCAATSATSASAPSATAVPQVVLARGKARIFREGERVVYGGAVKKVEGAKAKDVAPGTIVDLVDGEGTLVGWGPYNPESMFRVRLLWHVSEAPLAGAAGAAGSREAQLTMLLHERLRTAVQKRRRCGLPNASTSAYRLVNSEGDKLSGLVVDVFGSNAVVSSGAIWCEKFRDEITAAVQAALDEDAEEGVGGGSGGGGGGGGGMQVLWQRSETRLKQDGWVPGWGEEQVAVDQGDGGEEEEEEEDEDEDPFFALDDSEEGEGEEEEEGDQDEEEGGDEGAEEEIITELGLSYAVSLKASSQKTGFYCDQRDNRQLVRELVGPGDAVLDICTYTGGFALNAVAGGAKSVVAVDSSAPALETARRNAELNGYGEEQVKFVKGDMVGFLEDALKRGDAYDVVILDPPKLAPSRKSLENAKKKYIRLNRAGLKLISPGGLLVTCTCSSAMTRSGDFLQTISQAAREAGRSVSLLRREGPGPDHALDPNSLEGDYLSALYFHVE